MTGHGPGQYPQALVASRIGSEPLSHGLIFPPQILKALDGKVGYVQFCPALASSAGCPQPLRGGSQLKQVFRSPETMRADQVTSGHTSQPTSRGLASQKLLMSACRGLCLSEVSLSPIPSPILLNVPRVPAFPLDPHSFPHGPHGGHRGTGFSV